MPKRRKRILRQEKPRLRYSRILAWADAHHARTGQWPSFRSGEVTDAPGETWSRVNGALQQGFRGMRPGSTLVRFLYKHRGVTNKKRPPPLTLDLILTWADRNHDQTGKWPHKSSGVVLGVPGETWNSIADALSAGMRGLPRGSSLARLLMERRGAHNPCCAPRLAVRRILAWADAHRRRTGRWPNTRSGRIHDAPHETWDLVDNALFQGLRGLRPSRTLARFLNRYRGARMVKRPPDLTVRKILAWADAHRQRTRCWPKARSGPIRGAPGETWFAVESALNAGRRGLPAGSSVAKLLTRHRGVPNVNRPPRLTLKLILAAADLHRQQTGRWPGQDSGAVLGMPEESWVGINTALSVGLRGLPAGSSVARLLEEHRGARNRMNLPRWKIPGILKQADAHHRRTGLWPKRASGPIIGWPDETWANVDTGLVGGNRGLPGGSSLAQLLEQHRGVRNVNVRPKLTVKRILDWARAHRKRTGQWPRRSSGAIPEAPHDTWAVIDGSLSKGRRGLPGGSSLTRLLARYRRR